jgi:glycine/D-amino acid oxidase-like deaminating enzyme
MTASPHSADDDAPLTAIPLEHEHTPLWDELSQHLEQQGTLDLQALREELHRSPWRTSPAGEAIQRCLERNDPAELLTLAHRLGREWLAAG